MTKKLKMSKDSLEVQLLLTDLSHYKRFWHQIDPQFIDQQKQTLQFFHTFITNYTDIFCRTCDYGHITGSGFILSHDFSSLLMMHHKKLNKWIQLGGHCDGHYLAYEVALKECQEESGLTSLKLYDFEDGLKFKKTNPLIFDIDRHFVPFHNDVKEHFHFDICYLFVADAEEDLTLSSESYDLKWMRLEDIPFYNSEESIERPLKKIKTLVQ